MINQDGCSPSPEKVRAISEFPQLKTVVELRRFLGMVNFYRRSLPRAAEAQAPLNQFLCDSRKNDKQEIPWDTQSEAAFERVQRDLANATLLAHPSHDAETRLVTDASDFGMGASLEQKISSEWRPLAFFSRKFTPAQRNYGTYDRQLAAVYEVIRFFRYFLEGQIFKVVTDHKPLIYAFSQRTEKASQRQQRQISYISQFTTSIEYLPVPENVVADTLSRVEAIRLPIEFSLIDLAEAQAADRELNHYQPYY